MRDAYLEHMENRSGCCEYDEPEPIEEVEDRLQLALKNAYEGYLRGLYRELEAK